MKKIIIMAMAMGALSACTIKQHVDPINLDTQAAICIVENPDVREGFLLEMEKVLREKQINYRVVKELDARDGCEWTATYTASWAWDLALYLVYAEIKVFHEGKLDGEAIYDARMGGANMGKFIDAEPKIRELVEQLLARKQSAVTLVAPRQVAP
ncbi:Sbal_3080 family lipoprotein [Shewanella zhangzhouensis]|uniref:Sbal_3080 family lipoprotein n=1 Tax=Shewanella zhangzhouensis TaxID=2864213 RepID=UPI001C65A9AD|nr:Sbal_3080 family lipoprotein [Shewanella zhangzhouensis]QYK04861.1 hypothetical protein K0H63_17710 [Shewanella zhangzhouensis]